MATVFDVARYLLKKSGSISTWKLQKLCYYSQAWSLAWTGKPLFQEDFQAWSNGPVCPELFHAHQGKFAVSLSDFPSDSEDENKLTDEQMDTIERVFEEYGNMEPYELREQTHAERPWRDARGDLPDGEPSQAKIDKASIGEYYGSL